jgi:hypothetical protein
MQFSTVLCVYIVERYFGMEPCEAVKRAYEIHFPGAAVPDKSNIFAKVCLPMINDAEFMTCRNGLS